MPQAQFEFQPRNSFRTVSTTNAGLLEFRGTAPHLFRKESRSCPVISSPYLRVHAKQALGVPRRSRNHLVSFFSTPCRQPKSGIAARSFRVDILGTETSRWRMDHDTAQCVERLRSVLKSQYHAALATLRQAIDACPDDLWVSE